MRSELKLKDECEVGGSLRLILEAEQVELGVRERGVHPRVVPRRSLVGSSLPVSVQVVLELARISLLQGHLDLCQQYCAVLLETDKYRETACVVRGPPDLLPAPRRLPQPHAGCFPAPAPPRPG